MPVAFPMSIRVSRTFRFDFHRNAEHGDRSLIELSVSQFVDASSHAFLIQNRS
jgi:hypothetical protein